MKILILMPRTTAMIRHIVRASTILLIASFAVGCYSQEIQSNYADISIPGQWQSGKDFTTGKFGTDIFYDPGTGAVIQISQDSRMQKVAEISKYFPGTTGACKDAAGVMSVAAYPLPEAYIDRASRDLAKGTKPPKMTDVKEGEGNPIWFYASQLFDEYHVRDVGGSSEVTEEFVPVRVTKAEQRSIKGGDALLFEIESERNASDVALKRYHMPPTLKDQRVRYGWVQFAPGGIAAGQGVLSVAFSTPANSSLTIEDVLNQV